MNTALWICQGVLAVVFFGSGGTKISMSKERMLATGQTGVAPFPLPIIRVTAAAELLAAIGLLAPTATGILPGLAGGAAIGLCVVMVGAMISHARLGEFANVGVNVVILLVCAFVAWGRLGGH